MPRDVRLRLRVAFLSTPTRAPGARKTAGSDAEVLLRLRTWHGIGVLFVQAVAGLGPYRFWPTIACEFGEEAARGSFVGDTRGRYGRQPERLSVADGHFALAHDAPVSVGVVRPLDAE